MSGEKENNTLKLLFLSRYMYTQRFKEFHLKIKESKREASK